MFSLIITIISIALVAALALASIYYGGNAFTKGSSQAVASQYVVQSQQVAGAYQLLKSEGLDTAYSGNLDTLTERKYLSQVPSLFIDGYITTTGRAMVWTREDDPALTLDVCNALEVKAGRVPFESRDDMPRNTGADAQAYPGQYGCYTGEGVGFYYKT